MLAILTILEHFFGGIWGKIALYAAIALAVVGAYFYWQHEVAAAAAAQAQIVQLKNQIVQDQRALVVQETVSAQSATDLATAEAQNKALLNELAGVGNTINNRTSTAPATDLEKTTVSGIIGQEKTKP